MRQFSNFFIALLLLPGTLMMGQYGLAQPQQAAFNEGTHPGEIVFQDNCSSCHGNPDFPRAHTLQSLQNMTAEDLGYALTSGLMAAQGDALSVTQKALVIEFLARDSDEGWVSAMMCAPSDRTVDLDAPQHLTRVGIDEKSSRFMTASQAGLTGNDLSNLELAWAIGFPGTGALRSSPVVIGSTLFYAANGTRKVFALDAATGCAKWVFESPTRMRSSLTYSQIGENGAETLFYGDAVGFIYAIHAVSGELRWSTDVRSHGRGVRITGAPVVHDDKVIVSISDSGVGAAANPEHECCEGHGSVAALDATTGSLIWEYHTMPEAQYTGALNPRGVRLRGPSGAPIWSTPTVDRSRGLVYVTTGENTSHPATNTSDAVIALELETGVPRWIFQALPKDVWNMACGGGRDRANCPEQEESVLKDHDFGGSAVLVSLPEGDRLLAGQKSGDLWALNPDTGDLIWHQRVGDGTALGGNHWGVASDGNRVYLPINDPGVARDGFTPRPGMYSFFVNTGESSWSYNAQSDCENGRGQRVNACRNRYGLSATPLLIDNALVSASLDGRIIIFDKDDGSSLFEYDTVQEYSTINGIAGVGGSIDSHSIAAGGGYLFVGSGYGRFNQTPGNVLLAFKPSADID